MSTGFQFGKMGKVMEMDVDDGFSFLKIFIYLFLEKGEGREREKGRNMDAREKHQSVASHVYPNWGLNLQSRHGP